MSEGTPTYEPQHLPPWESGGGILNLPAASSASSAGAGAGGAGAGTAGGSSSAHPDPEAPPRPVKHSPRSDTSVKSRYVCRNRLSVRSLSFTVKLNGLIFFQVLTCAHFAVVEYPVDLVI